MCYDMRCYENEKYVCGGGGGSGRKLSKQSAHNNAFWVFESFTIKTKKTCTNQIKFMVQCFFLWKAVETACFENLYRLWRLGVDLFYYFLSKEGNFYFTLVNQNLKVSKDHT